MSKKNLLILTNVHGDEPDATEIMTELKKEKKLNCGWIIANPEAKKINKRFVDIDMNRNAPGSKNSKFYESRRVVEVLTKCAKYKTVIDIHGSRGNQGVFTIIPNPNLQNIILATLLPVKHVLIWPFNPKIKNGPIMKFIDCGVGIEFGPKKIIKTKKMVKKVIDEILESDFKFDPEKTAQKEFYFVYDKIRKVDDISIFKDFEKININNEEFYPCFVGVYKGIAFYKTKKIDFNKLILELGQ